VSRLGAGQSVLRFVTAGFAKEEKYAKNVIVFSLCVTSFGFLSCCLVVWMCANYFYSFNQSLYQFVSENYISVAFLVASMGFQAIFSQIFRASGRTFIGVATDNSLALCIFVIAVFFCYLFGYRPSLGSVVWLLSLVYFVVAISSFCFHLLKIKDRNFNMSLSLTAFLSFSVSAFVINVVNMSLSEAALYVAATGLNPKELSVFGVAFKVVKLVYLPLLVVNIVVEPLIVRRLTGGDSMGALLRGAASIAALPAVIFVTVMLIYGDLILAVLFGPDYGAGYEVMVVLLIGYLLNVITGPCLAALVMGGKERFAVWTNIFVFIVSLVLAVILMESYGGVGVAAGFSFGMVFGNLILMFFARKELNINTLVTLSPRLIRSSFIELSGKG
ncbi:MAG: polysaccharide biosynthesis C-terminal domain-containing protein, partial [Gammaproteobacteria bacterium]|nr:polysaccharide biosynthesis C-terminal domain-containing protein [Gammaproteobacteria bacterium]